MNKPIPGVNIVWNLGNFKPILLEGKHSELETSLEMLFKLPRNHYEIGKFLQLVK
jgi:hypothetical protein